MAQGIKAPDGTVIKGIPDDVEKFGPEVEAFYKYIKEQGSDLGEGQEYTFGEGTAFTRGEETPYVTREQKMEQRKSDRETAEAADIASRESTGYERFAGTAPVQQSSEDETSTKGILDSFIKEAGPMATITGAGLLAGGAPLATVLGLGAKGSELLSDLTGVDIGGNPLEAGRKFLEKAGVEDPDTMWERIAAGAGVGVDEAITAVLSGNVFKAIGTGVSTIKNAPTAIQKIGGFVKKAGDIFSSKAPTQLIGGAGAGGGAQGGEEIAKNQEWGPVGTALITIGGGIAGDLAATKMVDLVAYTEQFMRSSGKKLAPAVQEVIERTKAEGVDAVLSDFEPILENAKDRRNVRELASGGVRDIRGNVQNPQRRAAVTRLASEYGVDMNNPQVDATFTKVAQDFNETRGAQKEALLEAKTGVIEQLSSADSPVPTPKTNALIEELLKKGEIENIPGTENMNQSLIGWQTRLSDTQTVGRAGDTVLPQDKSLNTIEAMRESLGEGFKKADGTILDGSQKTANKLYRALREDMGDYVSDIGGTELSTTFEGAMSGLSDMADDLKTSSIKALIENPKAEVDTIASIIRNGKAEDVGILYKRLSPEGQAQARSAVISDVIEDIMKDAPISTRGERMFSPNEFADKIREYGGSKGILFDSTDTKHLDGLAQVLHDTRRSEKSALIKDVMLGEGVQGSQRLITGIIARNPFATIPTLLAAKATKGAMYRVMEKPFFRDLLIKYDALPNRARSGTAGTELLKRMNEVIRASAEAGDFNTQEVDNTQGEK